MQLTESERTFFLKKGNRITGPFSMLKLKAMLREGNLSSDDMFSVDKQQWHLAGELFPALRRAPAAEEIVLPPPPPSQQQPLPPPHPASLSTAPQPVSPAAGEVNRPFFVPQKEAELPPVESAAESSRFKLFCFDAGRCIALIWNFRESLQMYSVRAGRFYGTAAGAHYLLGVLFVLLFGKYYAVRFSYLFTPLLGIGVVSAVLGAVSLYAYLLVRYTLPAETKTKRRQEWQFLSAGLFMNYGTLCCTALALFHGVLQYKWVAVLLLFIDSAVLSSSIMQLRDYAEEKGKKWERIALCHVLLFNPLIVLLIYVFIKLM